MACINCEKIRSAILHGKMAEAAGLALDVFREKMGLSVEGEPVEVGALRKSDEESFSLTGGPIAVGERLAKPAKAK